MVYLRHVGRPTREMRAREHGYHHARIGIDASRATRTVRTGTENYSLYLIRALLSVDTDNRYCLYTDRPPAPHLFGAVESPEIRVLRATRL